MKHLFFFSILLLSLSLSAQINKGDWLVGGNASFDYSESKPGSINPAKAFTFDIAPNVGYFIIDQLALGTKLNYLRNRFESNDFDGTFESLFLTPFVRYYILKSDKMLNPFAESSYRFSILNSENSEQFTVGGGLAVFVNQNIAYEITLNYLNTTINNADNNLGSQGLMLGLGIQIHL
ncbi:hypothetical protein [Psychroflexus montanilacus]|uniref:hypothetical protein n=1 Tax=Psychroflexus montanilacus TaxID=2873598 RepID=UPI001CCF9006|nr:hypothetical protein [Psychroflexus montanilacus]MBZ9651545.1 hypothetical protein [Psychroflexus montanilacus]